jgi:hypothetical protein
MNWPLKIQGRFVTEEEVDEIRRLLLNNPLWNRSRLSRELCEIWGWQRSDGQIKDIACRELLRKLEFRSLIQLPPRQRYGPKQITAKIESLEIDQSLLSCSLSEIKPVQIINVSHCSKYEKAFNYLMKEYHYLSYGRPVGQNMKYLIIGKNERFLGCLLFGAAAWKMEARDQWIGWSVKEREKNLGLICNNTRFLILDWIEIPHLASHVLGACLRNLSSDWKRRYGTDIALVETFVDTTRYKGTCYKASNFFRVGQTKGRGRQDRDRTVKVSVKDIFLYPLHRNAMKQLLS